MRMESKEKVGERIKAIRGAYAADKSAKIKGGARKAGNGEDAQPTAEEPDGRAGSRDQRVRFEIPEDLAKVDYTKAETEMRDLVKGPDTSWVEEVPHQHRPHAGRRGDSAPPKATQLVEKALELANGPVLGQLSEASDDLYSWTAARVARDATLTLEELMGEMATYGLGDVAAEASKILEQIPQKKAGERGRVEVGTVQWPVDNQMPGQGELVVDGQPWTVLDYKEEVWTSEELASILKLPEPQEEKRQCVTRVLAAGVLQRELGRVPLQREVDVRAEAMRREQCQQALDAMEQMGEPAEFVTAVEHELRTYIHDILSPHHEKDFRSLAVFPLQDLREAKLVVMRADYKGDLLVETVVGPQWRTDGWHLWALIYRGHMMLVQVPSGWDAVAWLQREERYSTPSLGFSFFYHQRHDQSKTSPGRVPCRLCKGGRRAGEDAITSLVRRHSCLASVAALAGSSEPTMDIQRSVRPTAPELLLRELFAGRAVLTTEWERQEGRALQPVEVFEEPHTREGYRAEHDLLRPEVREAHLLRARQGPENVGWVASPCTSYCDWALQNGGTRTFAKPRGDEGGGITQKEIDGLPRCWTMVASRCASPRHPVDATPSNGIFLLGEGYFNDLMLTISTWTCALLALVRRMPLENSTVMPRGLYSQDMNHFVKHYFEYVPESAQATNMSR